MGTSRNCLVAKDIGWSKTMSPKDGDADIVVNVKDGSSVFGPKLDDLFSVISKHMHNIFYKFLDLLGYQ